MLDDDFSSASSTSSASSPVRRRLRPPPLTRRDPIGIDPNELIGKRVIRISRSSIHPTLTLDFDDHTTAQVLVDGYSPRWKGVPKELEMDEAFQRLTDPGFVGLDTLEIVDCAIIKLCDRAFQRKQTDNDQVRWDQEQRWHSNLRERINNGIAYGPLLQSTTNTMSAPSEVLRMSFWTIFSVRLGKNHRRVPNKTVCQ
ncbi:hypothetical protein F5878DRAFT_601578 [Lentinula raphanica]|uniref:Uncharacterized protein n=1 Tax=Lentinula raphanica TaxID=153919 RepID=A0AA38UKG8_9AGAR|nr:hypothetical protein F5878DRAFT_601578 [Lentinula raphanica]